MQTNDTLTVLFHRSIGEVEKNENVEERISDLNKHFTSIVYRSISRSLFQVFRSEAIKYRAKVTVLNREN